MALRSAQRLRLTENRCRCACPRRFTRSPSRATRLWGGPLHSRSHWPPPFGATAESWIRAGTAQAFRWSRIRSGTQSVRSFVWCIPVRAGFIARPIWTDSQSGRWVSAVFHTSSNRRGSRFRHAVTPQAPRRRSQFIWTAAPASCSPKVPLQQAYRKDGVITLPAVSFPRQTGQHDMCFAVEGADAATVWVLNYIQPMGADER